MAAIYGFNKIITSQIDFTCQRKCTPRPPFQNTFTARSRLGAKRTNDLRAVSDHVAAPVHPRLLRNYFFLRLSFHISYSFIPSFPYLLEVIEGFTWPTDRLLRPEPEPEPEGFNGCNIVCLFTYMCSIPYAMAGQCGL